MFFSFSQFTGRLLLGWDAAVIQGAAALVVHLVNSGWFEVVLGRSVQYGHSFEQLVLAYVIYFSVGCIALLRWVFTCDVSYAPWYLYLGFCSLGTLLLTYISWYMYVCIIVCAFIYIDMLLWNKWQAGRLRVQTFFVTVFSMGKFNWFTGIFITKRCISSCGERSYRLRRPYA